MHFSDNEKTILSFRKQENLKFMIEKFVNAILRAIPEKRFYYSLKDAHRTAGKIPPRAMSTTTCSNGLSVASVKRGLPHVG